MKKPNRFLMLILAAILLSSFLFGNDRSQFQDFFLQEGKQWRVHWNNDSIITAVYGRSRIYAGSSEQASRSFLEQTSRFFGIQDPSSLRHIKTITTKAGQHFIYQQFYGQYPVAGGQMRITLNAAHSIISAMGKYETVSRLAGSSIKNDERLLLRIRQLFGAQAYDAGIFVYPGGKDAYLVRRIEIEPRDGSSGSWLLYVDATDSHIIRYAAKTYAETYEGEGDVWTENPITTPRRSVQTLINMDASHTLSGKFVRLYNGNFQEDTRFPIHVSDYSRAKESDRKFNYKEDDPRLTEAMAYYQLNRVHDRWRSFGFTGLDGRAPAFVNVAASDGGPGYDNAYYSRTRKFPRTGIYVFGGGNEYNNTGLDAEVLYHEYGHGVLDHIEPGFMEARDSNYHYALHEAFGDISAAAISGTPRLFDFAFRSRDSGKWTGRNMNNRNRFPSDVIWRPVGISEPHHTGLILDGAWWDLQKSIGPMTAQELMYEAVNQVPAEVDFFQVRDAMLIADENTNGGAYSKSILSSFAKHGLSGPNPGQRGKLTIHSVMTASYTPSSDYQFTTHITRGQTVSIVVQYDASGLTPGYNLVPENLQFERPPGSDAFIISNIGEVTNGSHVEIHDALHILEITTTSSTAVGTYVVRFKPRLGGTKQLLPEQMLTFDVR